MLKRISCSLVILAVLFLNNQQHIIALAASDPMVLELSRFAYGGSGIFAPQFKQHTSKSPQSEKGH